jgi:hypothetical protein
MRAQVFAGIMHLVEADGAERLTLRGTALLRLLARRTEMMQIFSFALSPLTVSKVVSKARYKTIPL